jgi:hypothetical protein
MEVGKDPKFPQKSKNFYLTIVKKWFKMFQIKKNKLIKSDLQNKRTILKKTTGYNISTDNIDINTTINSNVGGIENYDEYVERLKEKIAVIDKIEVDSFIQFVDDPKYKNEVGHVLIIEDDEKTIYFLDSNSVLTITTRELMENNNWYRVTVDESTEKQCACCCS